MNTAENLTALSNKELVKQVGAYFVSADIESALSYMTEDVKMGWPGFFDLAPGKAAIREFFKNVPEMISSTVEDILEDGNKVAATGSVISKGEDGTLKKSFFCDIYELESGKIKSIKSYMIFEQNNSN